MRRVSVTGFMLTTGFIFATSLAAQQPPKGPDKKDPKIPETKVDQASENKWPTVIAGKKLDDWVKDMQNRDPSTREMALRTVVFFGPSSREAASVNLLHALTLDPDYGVKITAISMVPQLGFASTEYEAGLNYLVSQLKPTIQQNPLIRNAAITALGNCSSAAKRAIPNLIEFSLSTAVGHEKNFWQNRQAAAVALGQIGKNYPPPPKEKKKDAEPGGKEAKGKEAKGKVAKDPPKEAKDPPNEVIKELPPDPAAIRGLMKALHDPSHMVKRTALSSMMSLGPPDPPKKDTETEKEKVLQEYRAALRTAYMEKAQDKSVIIWSHVLYMQSETKQTKLEDPNLKDLDKFLDEKDSGIRLEAIQALGVLGEAARSRAVRLRSIAQGVEEDPAVINAAIYALAGMKSQKVSTLPVLERLRKHKNAVVVDTAEGAIALLTDTKREMKNDLVISSLLTIAGNKEAQPEAVIDAIWALSGMKAHSAKSLPVLVLLKTSKDRKIRDAAEAAVSLLSEKTSQEEPKKDAVRP